MMLKKKILALTMGILLLCAIIPAAAGGANAQSNREEPQVFDDEVRILGKGESVVFIWEAPFEVSPDTRITDVGGGDIPLVSLAVPCKAHIEYSNPPGQARPVLLSLKVLEYLPGASQLATPKE